MIFDPRACWGFFVRWVEQVERIANAKTLEYIYQKGSNRWEFIRHRTMCAIDWNREHLTHTEASTRGNVFFFLSWNEKKSSIGRRHKVQFEEVRIPEEGESENKSPTSFISRQYFKVILILSKQVTLPFCHSKKFFFFLVVEHISKIKRKSIYF